MEEKIKIIVKVRYSYQSSAEEKFVAYVSAYIPTDIDSQIPWELRDRNIRFFGNSLTGLWGEMEYKNGKGFRVREEEVKSNKSWEDLVEKVNEYIDKELEKLKEVAKKNRKNRQLKPIEFEKEFFI